MKDQSHTRDAHKRVYRCRLVQVLPDDGLDVTVMVRRAFTYAGRRYRRGETAVVKSAALSHLLLSRKVIWSKDLMNGTAVERAIDGFVSEVPMAGAIAQL